MDTYPAVDIDNETDIPGSDDITPDQADDGTIRGRVNFAATIFTGNIVHTMISVTDKDTVMAFYEAHKGEAFTFAHGGNSYTMYFARRPRDKHLHGGWWRVDVIMIGTMD